MPPRKKSRLTPVVGSGKNKPTAFKTLCLPDTGFMVDFLRFFTRDDFEKYLQLTCKRMNQLILTHFPSKPYRYLDNVTLKCKLNGRKLLCLSKPAANSASNMLWDPSVRQWRTTTNYEIGFSIMRPFLDETVRVPKVDIGILFTVMTQKIIDQLKSLSHIWENSEVEFAMGTCSKGDMISRAEQLNEAKLFRCRRLKCSYWDVMLPLWEYPEIYSLEVAEFDFFPIESEEFDPKPIIQFVENQAQYPNSQTAFVFSHEKHRYALLFTKTVLLHIRNKLMESDQAQSFRIIFAVHEKFELSDGGMDEIRLENKRAQEVLHVRLVTYNEVAKYCEFDAETKYYILERSQV